MTRVPNATRELVPDDLKPSFDAAIAERPGYVTQGGVMPKYGNYTVMMYSPEACRRLHHWSDYLRKDSILPKAIRELAMLVTAREHDCQYIWVRHAPTGRRVGLSNQLIEALRDRKPLPSLKREEAITIKIGQEYYRSRRVSKEAFQEAADIFGIQGVVELTMIMGFSAVLAFNLHAFDVDLPENCAEPLLPP